MMLILDTVLELPYAHAYAAMEQRPWQSGYYASVASEEPIAGVLVTYERLERRIAQFYKNLDVAYLCWWDAATQAWYDEEGGELLAFQQRDWAGLVKPAEVSHVG